MTGAWGGAPALPPAPTFGLSWKWPSTIDWAMQAANSSATARSALGTGSRMTVSS